MAAPFLSLVANLRTGVGSSQVHCQQANKIRNFTMNFGNFAPKVYINLVTKFTAMFERDMNLSNPFLQQGRSLPDNVCSEIVKCWLNGGGHREIEFAQVYYNEY